MPKAKPIPEPGPPKLSPSVEADQKSLFAAWNHDLHERVVAYDKGSTMATSYNTLCIVATGVGSAVAALGIFASAEEGGSFVVRIVAGILTVVVSATAFIQSQLGFGTKATTWRAASVALSGLRRQVQKYERTAATGAVDEKLIDGVSEAWGQAEAAVDSPYPRAWDFARKQVQE